MDEQTDFQTERQRIHEWSTEFVSRDNALTNVLCFIEAATGISKIYQFYSSALVTLLYFLVGNGAKVFAQIMDLAYPMYRSVTAIETSPEASLKKWLKFWCIYGCICCIESMLSLFIEGTVFYFFLRRIFVTWCYLNIENNGTEVLYSWMKRLVIDNRQKIQAVAGEVARKASVMMQVMAAKGVETATAAAAGIQTAVPKVKSGVSATAHQGLEMGKDMVGAVKRASSATMGKFQELYGQYQNPISVGQTEEAVEESGDEEN